MEIIRICAIGIITAFCALLLRESKSELSLVIAVAGGCMILLSVIDYFVDIFAVIKNIADKSGIPPQLFAIIAKIVGVGYAADFSAGIVEDAGQKALAEKIILGGKLIIMIIALPIVTLLFDTVSGLLQQ
ncbi:MAG: stage III sporulation AC/AD family protein [Clostridiales bacterium]|jgi:stage III sporulation protein AD|nr:stage III sporulation AC/AD family protein [Clostridiales bacterium]